MHPLKVAYCSYVKRTYGCWPGSLKDDEASRLAERIHMLRIPYDVYVETACRLMDAWTAKQGWKYPYWDSIASDKMLLQIKKLVDLTGIVTEDTEAPTQFEMELEYALAYIEWLARDDDAEEPKRIEDVPTNIKISVAEYMCELHGIECMTSDYTRLAKAFHAKDRSDKCR